MRFIDTNANPNTSIGGALEAKMAETESPERSFKS